MIRTVTYRIEQTRIPKLDRNYNNAFDFQRKGARARNELEVGYKQGRSAAPLRMQPRYRPLHPGAFALTFLGVV